MAKIGPERGRWICMKPERRNELVKRLRTAVAGSEAQWNLNYDDGHTSDPPKNLWVFKNWTEGWQVYHRSNWKWWAPIPLKNVKKLSAFLQNVTDINVARQILAIEADALDKAIQDNGRPILATSLTSMCFDDNKPTPTVVTTPLSFGSDPKGGAQQPSLTPILMPKVRNIIAGLRSIVSTDASVWNRPLDPWGRYGKKGPEEPLVRKPNDAYGWELIRVDTPRFWVPFSGEPIETLNDHLRSIQDLSEARRFLALEADALEDLCFRLDPASDPVSTVDAGTIIFPKVLASEKNKDKEREKGMDKKENKDLMKKEKGEFMVEEMKKWNSLFLVCHGSGMSLERRKELVKRLRNIATAPSEDLGKRYDMKWCHEQPDVWAFHIDPSPGKKGYWAIYHRNETRHWDPIPLEYLEKLNLHLKKKVRGDEAELRRLISREADAMERCPIPILASHWLAFSDETTKTDHNRRGELVKMLRDVVSAPQSVWSLLDRNNNVSNNDKNTGDPKQPEQRVNEQPLLKVVDSIWQISIGAQSLTKKIWDPIQDAVVYFNSHLKHVKSVDAAKKFIEFEADSLESLFPPEPTTITSSPIDDIEHEICLAKPDVKISYMSIQRRDALIKRLRQIVVAPLSEWNKVYDDLPPHSPPENLWIFRSRRRDNNCWNLYHRAARCMWAPFSVESLCQLNDALNEVTDHKAVRAILTLEADAMERMAPKTVSKILASCHGFYCSATADQKRTLATNLRSVVECSRTHFHLPSETGTCISFEKNEKNATHHKCKARLVKRFGGWTICVWENGIAHEADFLDGDKNNICCGNKKFWDPLPNLVVEMFQSLLENTMDIEEVYRIILEEANQLMSDADGRIDSSKKSETDDHPILLPGEKTETKSAPPKDGENQPPQIKREEEEEKKTRDDDDEDPIKKVRDHEPVLAPQVTIFPSQKVRDELVKRLDDVVNAPDSAFETKWERVEWPTIVPSPWFFRQEDLWWCLHHFYDEASWYPIPVNRIMGFNFSTLRGLNRDEFCHVIRVEAKAISKVPFFKDLVPCSSSVSGSGSDSDSDPNSVQGHTSTKGDEKSAKFSGAGPQKEDEEKGKKEENEKKEKKEKKEKSCKPVLAGSNPQFKTKERRDELVKRLRVISEGPDEMVFHNDFDNLKWPQIPSPTWLYKNAPGWWVLYHRNTDQAWSPIPWITISKLNERLCMRNTNEIRRILALEADALAELPLLPLLPPLPPPVVDDGSCNNGPRADDNEKKDTDVLVCVESSNMVYRGMHITRLRRDELVKRLRDIVQAKDAEWMVPHDARVAPVRHKTNLWVYRRAIDGRCSIYSYNHNSSWCPMSEDMVGKFCRLLFDTPTKDEVRELLKTEIRALESATKLVVHNSSLAQKKKRDQEKEEEEEEENDAAADTNKKVVASSAVNNKKKQRTQYTTYGDLLNQLESIDPKSSVNISCKNLKLMRARFSRSNKTSFFSNEESVLTLNERDLFFEKNEKSMMSTDLLWVPRIESSNKRRFNIISFSPVCSGSEDHPSTAEKLLKRLKICEPFLIDPDTTAIKVGDELIEELRPVMIPHLLVGTPSHTPYIQMNKFEQFGGLLNRPEVPEVFDHDFWVESQKSMAGRLFSGEVSYDPAHMALAILYRWPDITISLWVVAKDKKDVEKDAEKDDDEPHVMRISEFKKNFPRFFNGKKGGKPHGSRYQLMARIVDFDTAGVEVRRLEAPIQDVAANRLIMSHDINQPDVSVRVCVLCERITFSRLSVAFGNDADSVRSLLSL